MKPILKSRENGNIAPRAVDSEGNTLDFMLSVKRDSKAAMKFLNKVLKAKHNKQPRVINVDKNHAYTPAFKALKNENILDKNFQLRQVKYLNNRVEQDHREVKKITKASCGYKSFHTAVRTIKGIEIMHMINKGQVEGVRKRQALEQKQFAMVSLWNCCLKFRLLQGYSVL